MKIGLDLMGGDFAPEAVLKGIQLKLKENDSNLSLVLFGNSDIINKNYKELFEEIKSSSNITFVEAPEVIEMGESPTKAITHKRKSSIVLGYEYLKNNEIDVFIGAGNTGAMLVGALYSVKSIEGVLRPTLSTVLPKVDNKFGILLDVGINPDCRQDVLYQFGLLGSLYLKYVHNFDNPKVGLLNIGSEEGKGNLLAQAAHKLMKSTSMFNFIGNVEGYDIFSDKTDVAVCDGFTGNIVLKTAEGIYKILKGRGIQDEYLDSLNYEKYGGSPILGINKPAIIGHGISSPRAFMGMIDMSVLVVEKDMVGEIKKVFQQNY